METSTAATAMEKTVDKTDIFLWANNIDAIKDQLNIELFLFNKNHTVYSAGFSDELSNQMKPLFLLELLNFINMGPAEGLVVRDFEEAEAEENVLQRTELDTVEKADYLIDFIKNRQEEIQPFSDEEHEFRRVRGVVAKFTHLTLPQPFYVVKAISQTQVMKGVTAWMYSNGSFKPFMADAGLKISPDNQVLINGSDIFVFNQGKFERLFGYDIKKAMIADKKVKEIEAHFKLSFPEGLTLQNLVREKKAVINKLQKLDPTLVKQQQIMDHAEEMGLELMEDEAGAIIIMDSGDLTKFVNLLNDDYVTSDLTGIKYEVKGKKRLDGEDSGA